MELWEIEARLGIEDTIGRYVRAADGGRFDDLAALFTEDGVLETGQGAFVGRHAIVAMLEATRTSLGGTGPGEGGAGGGAPRRIRHHVSSLRIDLDGPDAARSTCYFLAIVNGPLDDGGVDHWGVYRDRFRRVDDRWLFAHRHAITEGVAPGGWAAGRD